MRDLYRALGLPDANADPAAIERALARSDLDQELRDTADFVLLNPARKTRYDWVLGRAQELSATRTRLGLPRDAALGPYPGSPGRTSRGPGVPPPGPPPHARAAWAGAAGLLLVMAVGWVGLHLNGPSADQRQPTTHPSGSGSPRGNGSSEHPPSATPAGEPEAQPPPEHGWLQMTSEIQASRPWKIETDAGQDYFLTLLDSKTQATVMTLYLRGGEPYQGQIPVGVFELAYATGNRWLGLQNAFGHGSKRIQPALTYRIVAGAGDVGSWNLKLHPTSCEGVPVPPPVSVTSDPPPAPIPAESSL